MRILFSRCVQTNKHTNTLWLKNKEKNILFLGVSAAYSYLSLVVSTPEQYGICYRCDPVGFNIAVSVSVWKYSHTEFPETTRLPTPEQGSWMLVRLSAVWIFMPCKFTPVRLQIPRIHLKIEKKISKFVVCKFKNQQCVTLVWVEALGICSA